MKPLEGITIIDLTHMLSGPYGTMLLADLGARTIKVEPIGHGENTRALLANSTDYSRQGMGAYFLTLNRGKESVCIDLKSPEGLAVFYDLVKEADVVFDNFSAGVTRRLKIDHDTLSSINPRIVTCSVTGFGETGPARDRPAFDQVVQGMGGGMSITGFKDGPPVRAGIPIGDLGGGVFGAIGVLSSLVKRSASGKGEHVDVSMLDAQVSMLNYMATMYLMSGNVPGRLGNGHFVHVPYNTFKTTDGYIIIACIGDTFFQRLLEVMPLPGLCKPEYQEQPGRFAHEAEINQLIQAHIETASTAHWLALLSGARIPCAPVNDFEQALSDPQILARDMVVDVTLQSGETLKMPGNPVKVGGSGNTTFTPPPLLGQDTDQVLSSVLGYSAETINALRRKEIIQ
ncbi:CaiB/BaiF CoA transferase family protein [Castellaniella sp.]|jgi:crotonobetainyl-CoA:carnitine CoA-transferase CaiB-like acyl-CoA transferase|uniref:CaiB/BaiF CoA transferase family protein n=1 Tax=Castellaniella sp. TaxID=1955812 RepID=UPI003A8D4487